MFLVNLHEFVPRSRANGPGERAVIWVQGCPRRCPGCFNPDTHEFAKREMVAIEDLESQIMAIEEIDGVTFSGGEPFEQAESLADLARRLRVRGMSVVCYTGYTLEQLRSGNREDWNALLEQIDLLIDGPFIESERCNEPYRGSANQRFIFLTGRIRSEEVYGKSQTAEFNLGADGTVEQTGFPELPDADAVFKEVSEILNKKKEDSE